jgi:hypothetical protein
MQDLRRPGVLITLGYLGIAAGTVAWLVALYSENQWEVYVSQATPTIGYGLAGFACWRWIVRCRAANSEPSRNTPSRWMAGSSLIFAAGWAAETYWYYQTHQNLVHLALHGGGSFVARLDPHYRLRMAAGMSIVVGLLLAGVGFWIASIGTRGSMEPIEAAIPVS